MTLPTPLDRFSRNALRVYLAVAAGFILLLLVEPYPGSSLIKALPALIMAFLCYRYLRGAERWLMLFGFLFAAGGDVFLDLDRTAYFRQGLLCFLVTQILYSTAFLRRRDPRTPRYLAAAVVVAYALVMLILLWNSLGDLRIPVLVYIVALTTMGISAALREGPLGGVYLGGVLFVIADSIIAINKFLIPFDWSLPLILILYFSGQYLIGRGVLETRKGDLAGVPAESTP